MTINNFRDMYLTELQEARSVEKQLVDALPRMRKAASDPDLQQAITDHLKDTQAQLARLESILERHGVAAAEHEDQSMRRLVAESEKWIEMLKEGPLRDAGLIASAQRIEHYEIAVYGTLATWAKQLELEEDLGFLLAILEQEKTADDALVRLAKREVNPSAVG